MTTLETPNFMNGGTSNRLSPSGFFYYVFNFDSDNKALLFNMLQYLINKDIESMADKPYKLK